MYDLHFQSVGAGRLRDSLPVWAWSSAIPPAPVCAVAQLDQHCIHTSFPASQKGGQPLSLLKLLSSPNIPVLTQDVVHQQNLHHMLCLLQRGGWEVLVRLGDAHDAVLPPGSGAHPASPSPQPREDSLSKEKAILIFTGQFCNQGGEESLGARMNRTGGKGEAEDSAAAELFLTVQFNMVSLTEQ